MYGVHMSAAVHITAADDNCHTHVKAWELKMGLSLRSILRVIFLKSDKSVWGQNLDHLHTILIQTGLGHIKTRPSILVFMSTKPVWMGIVSRWSKFWPYQHFHCYLNLLVNEPCHTQMYYYYAKSKLCNGVMWWDFFLVQSVLTGLN